MALDLSKATSASMIKNIASKSSEENLKKTVKNISIDLVDFNNDNDKIFSVDNLDSLVLAIQRNGFKGNIEVFIKKDGRYEIISGHRRFLANRIAGNKTIPCEIKEEPSEIEKADLLIISNITSRQLTPLEKGRAIVYYKENVLKKESFKGNVRDEIARRFGYSASNVHKYEALTKLIKELQDLVEKDGYPFAPISSASCLENNEQLELYKMIIDHSAMFPDSVISGTRIEDFINRIKNKNNPDKAALKNESGRDNVKKAIQEQELKMKHNVEKLKEMIPSEDSLNIDPEDEPEVFYIDKEVELSANNLINLFSNNYEIKDKKRIKKILNELMKVIEEI